MNEGGYQSAVIGSASAAEAVPLQEPQLSQ